MTIETFPWNGADHLDTDEAIAMFAEAVLEGDDDAAFLGRAVDEMALGCGYTVIARQAGMSRQALVEALRAGRGDEGRNALRSILARLAMQASREAAE